MKDNTIHHTCMIFLQSVITIEEEIETSSQYIGVEWRTSKMILHPRHGRGAGSQGEVKRNDKFFLGRFGSSQDENTMGGGDISRDMNRDGVILMKMLLSPCSAICRRVRPVQPTLGKSKVILLWRMQFFNYQDGGGGEERVGTLSQSQSRVPGFIGKMASKFHEEFGACRTSGPLVNCDESCVPQKNELGLVGVPTGTQKFPNIHCQVPAQPSSTRRSDGR